MIETVARAAHLQASASEHLWGASSETGRLTDVVLSSPLHLALIPCNAVAVECVAQGLRTSQIEALRQHRAFAAELEKAGVRCHFIPPQSDMPDLTFTRDALVMTPWGVVELRPSVPHRRTEAHHAALAVRALGAPPYDRIEQGTIEGGDVCLVRDGLVLIGHSEERTTRAGAEALGAVFLERGWRVLYTRFDPRYLHLDTILTMVADDCAVVLHRALEESVLDELRALGIELIPANKGEVQSLAANMLSLGGRRVVAAQGSGRLAAKLDRRGIQVIEVAVDQFTRCGGGPHCLTMPLARLATS